MLYFSTKQFLIGKISEIFRCKELVVAVKNRITGNILVGIGTKHNT